MQVREPDSVRYRSMYERGGAPAPLPRLRALSLHRPYPDAILRGVRDEPGPGPKDIENRSWMPPHDAVGQDIAIHAGLKYHDAFTWPGGWQPPGDSPTGIVGVARLAGAARRSGPRHLVLLLPRHVDAGEERRLVARLERMEESVWWAGPVGWLLEDRIAIEPVPCKGRQGLWYLDTDVAAEVRRRAEQAREAA